MTSSRQGHLMQEDFILSGGASEISSSSRQTQKYHRTPSSRPSGTDSYYLGEELENDQAAKVDETGQEVDAMFQPADVSAGTNYFVEEDNFNSGTKINNVGPIMQQEELGLGGPPRVKIPENQSRSSGETRTVSTSVEEEQQERGHDYVHDHAGVVAAVSHDLQEQGTGTSSGRASELEERDHQDETSLGRQEPQAHDHEVPGGAVLEAGSSSFGTRTAQQDELHQQKFVDPDLFNSDDSSHRIPEIKKMALSGRITELHDVIQTVHTFAKHNYYDHALFSHFSEHCLQKELWRCSWDELVQITWSYATNREYDEKLFVRVAEIMLRKIDRANPTQVIRCVSAFTRLNFRDDRVLYVMGRRIRKCLKEDQTSLVVQQREAGGFLDRFATHESKFYPSRFFEPCAASFPAFCQLLEIYARTSYVDAPALTRVFRYLIEEKPRMWVESRANIGRFAYYCHWLGVWHDGYLGYLKKEFLYSSEFEDEVALFDAATRPEIGREKNAYLDKEDKTKGGLQLHRLREKRVEWRKQMEMEANETKEQQECVEVEDILTSTSTKNLQLSAVVVPSSTCTSTSTKSVPPSFPCFAETHKPDAMIKEDNLSALIISRATTLAFSLYGHTDLGFLNRLLTIWNSDCDEIFEKDDGTTANDEGCSSSSSSITSRTSTSKPSPFKLEDKTEEMTQNFASRRFCTALVSCRFFVPQRSLLRCFFHGFSLRNLRNLMPDLYCSPTSGTTDGPRGQAGQQLSPAEDFSNTTSARPQSHKTFLTQITVGPQEILATVPKPDDNVGNSSVLHEEVSAAVESVYKMPVVVMPQGKGRKGNEKQLHDHAEPEPWKKFERFCGLYFVDTVLPPGGKVLKASATPGSGCVEINEI
ncbi:unnamed protein product [Amoebophrya sp. A120]|nr:unnamed protein product [Amoebophrya sp. A120]|eukprot:GSA120T00019324001.1